MQLRGQDTTTGGFTSGDPTSGFLCRNYTKRAGDSTISLSEVDSGMYIWASTNNNDVTIQLPGHALNTVQSSTPQPGTHYRIIRNSNDSNILKILSSDGTAPDLKCLALLLMEGLRFWPPLGQMV